MEAVVMAEIEMRLLVGVTSTWSTLRPRGSSGALAGREFFMAFASWRRHVQIDKQSHDQSRVASQHLKSDWDPDTAVITDFKDCREPVPIRVKHGRSIVLRHCLGFESSS